MADGLRAESKHFEYRVKWQREGRSPTSKIIQTEAGARAKIDRLLALDEVKGDSRTFEDMPDLVGVPTLEVREVGSWQEHPEPPAVEPSDAARKGMSVWANPHDENWVF